MKTNNYLKNELKRLEAQKREYINKFYEGFDHGMPTPYDNAIDAVVEKLIEADKIEFAKNWTPEITKTRRTEWNTWIKSTFSGRIDMSIVSTQEKKQGWTMADLKKAIELNNL